MFLHFGQSLRQRELKSCSGLLSLIVNKFKKQAGVKSNFSVLWLWEEHDVREVVNSKPTTRNQKVYLNLFVAKLHYIFEKTTNQQKEAKDGPFNNNLIIPGTTQIIFRHELLSFKRLKTLPNTLQSFFRQSLSRISEMTKFCQIWSHFVTAVIP